jgi:hypothetical protein
MKLRLPFTGITAELLWITWQQVLSAPAPRVLDKHISKDPELCADWQSSLDEGDDADGSTLSKLLQAQLDPTPADEADLPELELSPAEIHEALRACARARLYIHSPWCSIELPRVSAQGKPVPPAQLMEQVSDVFATMEAWLLGAIYLTDA